VQRGEEGSQTVESEEAMMLNTCTNPLSIRRPRTAVLKLSAFDGWTATWQPEPGSKAYERLAIKQARENSKRFHWSGSNCGHVVGKWAFLAKDRTLDGYRFDAIDQKDRCGNCQTQFLNA
jgi:hypothetical protein